jgi:hypothetical protein
LHQCPQLDAIIEIFSGGKPRFTTDELLAIITEKIVRHRGVPIIDGLPAANGSLTIANFLFRTGFITGRDEKDVAGLGFVRFEDRPNLLTTTANIDDGLSWEVHPAYRDILRIR